MSEAIYRNIGTYLNQDHHSFIKESFKVLANLIEKRAHELPQQVNALDVGCATGALIGYLKQRFPDYSFTGIDNSPELLEVGRAKIGGVPWLLGTALDLPSNMIDHFDLSFLMGVLSIFDEKDAQKALSELIRCTRKGGYIYVFGQFNDHEVDTLIQHRKYKDEEPGPWEKGWNLYSQRTLQNWLKDKVTYCRFIDFNFPFDLEPKEDPVRTWTIKMEGSQRRLTNGLKLLVDLKFLEIKV